jgi:hypothetical protein
MDQETAIYRSAKAIDYFHRKGITLVPRATSHQVAYIDRRGALLREVIHNIVTQLQTEGIDCPFGHVLSEATICSNALLSINKCTPYNAVYGRVPALLPGIDQAEAPNEQNLSMPGTIRHTHRIREISVQQMIEGAARAIIQRAMQTRSLLAGQR